MRLTSVKKMAGSKDLAHLKLRLEMCIKVLNKYSWLLDAYILVKLLELFSGDMKVQGLKSLLFLFSFPPDFFVENHIENLPKSWKNHIRNIPLEELYYLLNVSAKTQTVWPLSIICLRVLIQHLQISRKLSETYDVNLIQSNKIDTTRMSELNILKSPCYEHPKLRNYFLKHVKPKKRYEIFKMATTTAEIANQLGIQYVVDVGSGLGHLSRIMAYGFDLQVCSIETQSQLIKQAEQLDYEFEKISSRFLSESQIKHLKTKKPVHLNQTIKFNLTSDDFVEEVKKAFSVTEKNFKFGIVGLHPCGDLAVVLLKLFTNSPEAKFINLVGCCYHKLSTSWDSEHDIGFPLTDFCSEKGLQISYEARALACHAIESYRERLASSNYNHLKVHCYRAALENLINKNWPKHRKSALSNVKSVPDLTFNEYCQLALKKLNLTVLEEDLNSRETVENLARWEDVVKFYSLRLMLAPLIESAILLDRKIFLLEKGFQCKLEAAFDPEISPRNQLLISQKTV